MQTGPRPGTAATGPRWKDCGRNCKAPVRYRCGSRGRQAKCPRELRQPPRQSRQTATPANPVQLRWSAAIDEARPPANAAPTDSVGKPPQLLPGQSTALPEERFPPPAAESLRSNCGWQVRALGSVIGSASDLQYWQPQSIEED